jgi:hypothetical protein
MRRTEFISGAGGIYCDIGDVRFDIIDHCSLFIDERAEISEDLREFVYTGFDLKDF